MKYKINLSIQLLPLSSNKKEVYDIVDKAIEIINTSGLKYKVSAYETVIEGYYDEVMNVVYEIQQMASNQNVDDIISYIKIHQNTKSDVSIEDKTQKYSN